MTALPEPVRDAVERVLGQPVVRVDAVGGGCISNATRVETKDQRVFLKWTPASQWPLLRAEADGLAALASAGSELIIPKMLFLSEAHDGDHGMLILDWVDQGRPSRTFWQLMGQGLAQLHRSKADAFGFAHNNFIGLTPQLNGWMSDWPTFFLERRLSPQVELARRNGRWRSSWNRLWDSLGRQLSELLPASPAPSLLHGDLWSGNFIASVEGRPVLIDPAVYHGDRETDLAFTRLFGGFDDAFYRAYEEVWPLDDGAHERIPIYNLYHLLNHLNLFGAAYASGVEAALRRY